MIDRSLQDLAALLALPYRIDHIPLWKRWLVERAPNRPARKRATPDNIPTHDTAHETANRNIGANALMHAKYVRAPNWGGDDKTSYHHVVDDKECIELLPWEEVAYHGGTSESNNNWLGFEMCVNQDSDRQKMLDNAAKLVAIKMVKFEKPIGWVLQHNAAYGKDCPAILRHTPGAWDAFLRDSARYAENLKDILRQQAQPPTPTEPVTAITVNGHTIHHGFLDLWRKYGVDVMGLPLSEEYTEFVPAMGAQMTFQDFENVIVEWPGPNGEPRIGAGIRRLKYENT